MVWWICWNKMAIKWVYSQIPSLPPTLPNWLDDTFKFPPLSLVYYTVFSGVHSPGGNRLYRTWFKDRKPFVRFSYVKPVSVASWNLKKSFMEALDESVVICDKEDEKFFFICEIFQYLVLNRVRIDEYGPIKRVWLVKPSSIVLLT